MKKICIIGMGNMGQAIFDILSTKNLFEVKGCGREDDVNEVLKDCDVFFIAIKPQDFQKLSEQVSVDLSDKLVISIMAGVSVSKIKEKLKIKKVVRMMPNLPLKVGMALSGWYLSEEVSSEEKSLIQKILSSIGEEVEVKNEEQINMITAISGSGPAYFYFLAELLEKAAIENGFSQTDAKKIAKTTFLGSAFLLKHLDEDPKSLRAKVTSKGGTTEAALNYLEKNNFDKTFLEAIKSAYNRSKELNNN